MYTCRARCSNIIAGDDDEDPRSVLEFDRVQGKIRFMNISSGEDIQSTNTYLSCRIYSFLLFYTNITALIKNLC